MPEDMDKRVEQYIQIRDALKRIDADHDAKRKPLVDLQQVLSGRIQVFLDENKLKNIKTKHGTAHTTTRYTASLADPDAFMRYVEENKAFHLMDRRANATAVKDYVKEHNVPPPGVNLNALTTVGVRRPGEKAE